MARFAPFAALALSLLLALPAAAVDTGGGDGGGNGGGGTGGGGSTGGGGTSASAGGGSSSAGKSTASADQTPFTPLDQARAAVREGRYQAAMKRLQRIVKADPQNADAWNLLGFSYRMLGDLDRSSAAYLQVLAINPDHLGALEYQGELFITQGNLRSARANLERLRDLCGDCEEAEDLANALGES